MTFTTSVQDNGVITQENGVLRVSYIPFYKIDEEGRAISVVAISNITDERINSSQMKVPRLGNSVTSEELGNWFDNNTYRNSFDMVDNDGTVFYQDPFFSPPDVVSFKQFSNGYFSGKVFADNGGFYLPEPSGSSYLDANSGFAFVFKSFPINSFRSQVPDDLPGPDSLDAIYFDNFGNTLFGESGFVAQVLAQNNAEAEITLSSPTEGNLEFVSSDEGIVYSFVSDVDIDINDETIDFSVTQLSEGKKLYTIEAVNNPAENITTVSFSSNLRLSEENVAAAFQDDVQVVIEPMEFIEAEADLDAPVTTPDAIVVNEGQVVEGNVLSNDFDASSMSLTSVNGQESFGYGNEIQVAGGVLCIYRDGRYRYTSNLFKGVDKLEETIQYTVADEFGNSSTGEITITNINLEDPFSVEVTPGIEGTDYFTQALTPPTSSSISDTNTNLGLDHDGNFWLEATNGETGSIQDGKEYAFIAVRNDELNGDKEPVEGRYITSKSFTADTNERIFTNFSQEDVAELFSISDAKAGADVFLWDVEADTTVGGKKWAGSMDGVWKVTEAQAEVTGLPEYFEYSPLNDWKPAARIEINPGGPAAEALGDQSFQNDGRLMGLNNRVGDSTYGDLQGVAYVLGKNGAFDDLSIRDDDYIGTMEFSKQDGYRTSADFNSAQQTPLAEEQVLDGALVDVKTGDVLIKYDDVINRDPLTGFELTQTGSYQKEYWKAGWGKDKFHYKGTNLFDDQMFVVKDSLDNREPDTLTGENYSIVLIERGADFDSSLSSGNYLMSETFKVQEGQRTFVAIDGDSVRDFKRSTQSDTYEAALLNVDEMKVDKSRGVGGLSKQTFNPFDNLLGDSDSINTSLPPIFQPVLDFLF